LEIFLRVRHPPHTFQKKYLPYNNARGLCNTIDPLLTWGLTGGELEVNYSILNYITKNETKIEFYLQTLNETYFLKNQTHKH
jgi:hypothetical protein